ncbi:hypothetical protein ATKI12_2557 [Kitasatospora sp. Ki12]
MSYLSGRTARHPGGQWRASHRCQVECSHGIAGSGASARVKER